MSSVHRRKIRIPLSAIRLIRRRDRCRGSQFGTGFSWRDGHLQDLTELSFGEMVSKARCSREYGGTDDLGRNRRRQERSSPRGGSRSNLGCLDQEDLQDGCEGPNSLSQDFQFDQIRPSRYCSMVEMPIQNQSHSGSFATEPRPSEEKLRPTTQRCAAHLTKLGRCSMMPSLSRSNL